MVWTYYDGDLKKPCKFDNLPYGCFRQRRPLAYSKLTRSNAENLLLEHRFLEAAGRRFEHDVWAFMPLVEKVQPLKDHNFRNVGPPNLPE